MISGVAGIEALYSRSQLISALEEHLTKHKEDYKKAVEVYYADMLTKAKDAYEKAQAGEWTKMEVHANFGLHKPVNCEKEYIRMINVFKQMTTPEISLNMSEADSILNNEWDWIQRASASNSFYSSRAR